MSEDPFAKYTTPATPSDSSDPFAKYVAKPQAQTPGWLSSLGSGAMHGLGNVLYGAAQLGPRIPSPFAPFESDRLKQANVAEAGRIDTEAQQRQQAYQGSPGVQAHPIASKIGEIGGEIAGTAPMSLIPGLGGAQTAMRTGAGLVGRGAAMGGLGAATAPVTGGDFWSEKGKQVALGAALGGALPAVGSAVAPRLPAPAAINKAFRPLWNFFTGAEERTVPGFDRAVARQALEPIGADIPRNAKGHALVDATENAIGHAYDQVLPQLQMNSFTQADLLAHDPELAMTVSELGTDEARQFETILKNRVFDKLQGRSVVDGQVIKDMQKDLGRRGISFLGGGSDDLGRALLSARQTLSSMVAQQNPAQAPALSRADEAWKMYSRMRAAASGSTAMGDFTPADLLKAIRREDRSAGKGAFSRGDALLQGYAEAGHTALGTKNATIGQLAHVFTRNGLLAEFGRGAIQPIARGLKSATPFVAAPGGMLAGQASNQGVPPIRPALPQRPAAAAAPMRKPENVDYIEPPPRTSVTGP